MGCFTLAVILIPILCCGCDALVYTAQPLSVTVLDRLSAKPMPNVRVSVAPTQWGATARQQTDQWIDDYVNYWDVAIPGEANAVRTQEHGIASLLTNTGTILRTGLFPSPLPDQLTDSESFIRVQTSSGDEIIRLRLNNGGLAAGARVLVRVEQIGKPREVSFHELPGQNLMPTH